MKNANENSTNLERFTMLVDRDQLKRVKILAVEQRVSASELMRAAVAQVIARHERSMPITTKIKA